MKYGTLFLVSLLVLLCATAQAQPVTLFGPSIYYGAADSPFPSPDNFSYFYLENFEDESFDVPGVTASTGYMSGHCQICDSVDEDDGAIDGNGCGVDWFAPSGPAGIRFTFDANVLGHLPTHVGLVWTDGYDVINFEAFGPDGASLGTLHGSHAVDIWTCAGGAGEDRFYGAASPSGIGSIFINCGVGAGGGIEVDHLQYGFTSTTAVLEPGLGASLRLLKAPAPNPANGGLSIAFALPSAARAKVQVFDLAGRYVTTLLDETIAAGDRTLRWDARDESGRAVASGTYFVRLEALGRTESVTVLITK